MYYVIQLSQPIVCMLLLLQFDISWFACASVFIKPYRYVHRLLLWYYVKKHSIVHIPVHVT